MLSKSVDKNNLRKIFRLTYIIVAVILLLICQIVVLMIYVNALEGTGRVVNYAGIVRGATQRLVKNELYGNEDDAEIARLDDVLLGLKTGKGTQNLKVLDDKKYKQNLDSLIDQWEKVKNAIYEYRDNPELKGQLFEISESYFILADKTVDSAEKYADNVTKKLDILNVFITITILLTLCLMFVQFVSVFRKNTALNKIARIDIQTGLPNKLSCEEKIKQISAIDEGKNVCCMMFDINNLKVTNDTYGHAVGDELIIHFASLLKQNMTKDTFIGRLGGDEFIGIIMNADEKNVQERIDNLLRDADKFYINVDNGQLQISFAYGYAFSNHNKDCTIQCLMNIADKNMYQNKALIKANKNN